MKKQIKELQKYFIDKLLSGRYKIIETNKYTIILTIDIYVFVFWIGNGLTYFEQVDKYEYLNFMQLEMGSAELESLYNNLNKKKHGKSISKGN